MAAVCLLMSRSLVLLFYILLKASWDTNDKRGEACSAFLLTREVTEMKHDAQARRPGFPDSDSCTLNSSHHLSIVQAMHRLFRVCHCASDHAAFHQPQRQHTPGLARGFEPHTHYPELASFRTRILVVWKISGCFTAVFSAFAWREHCLAGWGSGYKMGMIHLQLGIPPTHAT